MDIQDPALFTPQCRVFIDGVQIKNSAEMIESVTVRLSVSEMANSCEIAIFCDYDHDKSTVGGIIATASPGKKVKVDLGYRYPKTVFVGYINSTGVSFSQDGVNLSLSCLDARGLLMGNTSREGFENKSVSQIVNELLKPVRSYTEGITVTVPGAADKEYPISQFEMDDYRFICLLARITGCSFFMDGTVLKFVKDVYSSATLQGKFQWGRDVISFERQVELSDQVGKIRVMGRSPDTLDDFFAEVSPVSGKGKNGAALCSPVRGKVREVVSKTIKSQNEARIYAEALMRQSCLKLCRGSAEVLGDESIKPGKKVMFGGLDPKLNGTYYVTSVTHSFNSGGFLTNIGFCSPTD